MLTSTAWVPRGASKQVPIKIKLDDKELNELLNGRTENSVTSESDEDEQVECSEEDDMINSLANGSTPAADDDGMVEHKDDDVVKLYGLGEYDEDEGTMMSTAGMSGLVYHSVGQKDPYITFPDLENEEDDDENIKPTDNLIAAGLASRDEFTVVVYVYNDEEGSQYAHHDIILPMAPICLEWIGFEPCIEEESGGKGNYLAVGTLQPFIEIWDLDIINTLEPAYILGKKVKDRKTLRHRDAVITMSWNRVVRDILSSGSVDKKVLLWDLNNGSAVQKFAHHTAKVTSVCWHPLEANVLLTGSEDKMATIIDVRDKTSQKSVGCNAPVEQVIWNQFSPYQFLVALENGEVCCYDARNSEPVFTISAHDKCVTGISLSSGIPGCLVSISEDGFLKFWDILSDQVSFVYSRKMHTGSLFTVSACPDVPSKFVVGGNSDGIQIVDIMESAQGRDYFRGRTSIQIKAEVNQPPEKKS